jgi:hypothetical protein
MESNLNLWVAFGSVYVPDHVVASGAILLVDQHSRPTLVAGANPYKSLFQHPNDRFFFFGKIDVFI